MSQLLTTWNPGNIMQKIKKMFRPKYNKVIGFDIGASSLKIVESEVEKGEFVLKAISVVDIPPGVVSQGRIIDMERLTEVARQQLITANISSKVAVLSIGGKSMFAREVTFPSMSLEELTEAVKWDVERYVPFQAESFYYDFSLIGKGKTDLECKVLLVAGPKDMIDERIQLANSLGLKAIAVDIEPLALYRMLPASAGHGGILILDIGADSTQLSVFYQDNLVVTRSINLGGKRFTSVIEEQLELDFIEAETLKKKQRGLLSAETDAATFTMMNRQLVLLVDEMVREIQRMIEFSQKQNRDLVISNLYVTGGGARLDNLTSHIQTKLNLQVLLLDFNDKFALSQAMDSSYVTTMMQQVSVAAGLACYGGEKDEN